MSEDDLAKWLRRRIEERRYLAQHAIELGNLAEWTEQSSGVLFYAEPTETDTWHGMWAMGDSSVTRLMEANDPRDTIARCEAELAVLDEHTVVGPRSRSGPVCNTCMNISVDPANDDEFYVPYPCRTVRLIASGYQHRPGYLEEWKP